MSFGFIILRHIRNESQNDLWIESYTCIRKHYPETLIMVIDDNSNYEYIDNKGIVFKNTFFVQSEYPARGELLPYYYLYKYPIFDKAVFIHDSSFVQSHLNYSSIPDKVKFLWHFPHKYLHDETITRAMLSELNEGTELIDFHDNHQDKWLSCFGTMTFIHRDHIVHLQDKYNIFKLINIINCREHRCSLERVFGLLCCHDNNRLVNNPSLFGDIHYQFSIYRIWAYHSCFNDYLEDKENNKFEQFSIVKILGGDR